MSETGNPYNCSMPGNLFVGYERERRDWARQLLEGHNLSLLGGRRCGKTSILLSLEAELVKMPPGPQRLIPRYLDMQAVVPRTPLDFFRAIDESVTQGLAVEPWSAPSSSQPYQELLKRLRQVKPALEKQYSPRWTCVLLLDELDAAAVSLGDDECFQNLRNLLTVSDFRHHFRVVCAGVSRTMDLIKRGSPLNILDPIRTRLLMADEARQLMTAGFPGGPGPEREEALLRQSGGHPFLLQGLLGYLWDLRNEVGAEEMAAHRFVKDRLSVFRTWSESLGRVGRAVYGALLGAPGERASRSALRSAVKGDDLDEALDLLGFHGLVADRPAGQVGIAGDLFRDWYRASQQELSLGTPPPAALPVPQADRAASSVFVVHGRNLKIKAALFELLSALGLEPLEWSDMVEKTGAAAPSILEVIKAGFTTVNAVVVIFSPDDEARPHDRFQHDAEEGTLQGQPRANVLFEAGMAIALFPTRTVFLKIGKMRLLSDLGGLHMIEMDGSWEKRKELARRLRTAGCAVSDDSTAWHKAGDFTP